MAGTLTTYRARSVQSMSNLAIEEKSSAVSTLVSEIHESNMNKCLAAFNIFGAGEALNGIARNAPNTVMRGDLADVADLARGRKSAGAACVALASVAGECVAVIAKDCPLHLDKSCTSAATLESFLTTIKTKMYAV